MKQMDINEVLILLEKINFNIEEEEKILLQIKNSFFELEESYQTAVTDEIKQKNHLMITQMDKILENRENYISFIKKNIQKYQSTMETSNKIFSQLENDVITKETLWKKAN